MSKDKRPIGSWDWNGNGEYDFFDKVTDLYVYDKVTNHKPEPKPLKKSHKSDPGEYHEYTPKENLECLLFAVVAILVIIIICVLLSLPYLFYK